MEKIINKFKKTNQSKYVLCFILLLIAFFMIAISLPSKKVDAENNVISDDQEIEYGSESYMVSDENLYNALVDAYNFAYPSTPISSTNPLKVGSFKNFTGNSVTPKMLDLSNRNISDISGLYCFNFSGLEALDLSNNSISGDFSDFDYFSGLVNLDLSNNKLNSFENDFSNVLKNINLSNNNLTQANLGTLAENADVNLSFNKFSSFSKIITPSTNCTIKLTHNMIVEDFSSISNITLVMGLQGVNENASLLQSSIIKFYSLDGVDSLEILKKIGDNYEPFDCLINGNEEITNLSINSYKLIFNHTGEKIYDDILFTIRPNTPSYYFTDKNNNEITLIGNITNEQCLLKLSGGNNIYYTVNNGNSIKGNEISIINSGSYTITFWQEIDGVESEKTSVVVISKYYNPLSLIWILIGIVAFVILFYAGIKWKNSFNNISKNNKKSFFSNRNFE